MVSTKWGFRSPRNTLPSFGLRPSCTRPPLVLGGAMYTATLPRSSLLLLHLNCRLCSPRRPLNYPTHQALIGLTPSPAIHIPSAAAHRTPPEASAASLSLPPFPQAEFPAVRESIGVPVCSCGRRRLVMRVYQTAVTVTGVPCAPSPLLYEEPLRTVRFMGRGCQNQSRSGTSRLVPARLGGPDLKGAG